MKAAGLDLEVENGVSYQLLISYHAFYGLDPFSVAVERSYNDREYSEHHARDLKAGHVVNQRGKVRRPAARDEPSSVGSGTA